MGRTRLGTADAIVIADGTLQIIDFKYGLGVLVSTRKTRSVCYALGALELFDDIYDISAVRMTIISLAGITFNL